MADVVPWERTWWTRSRWGQRWLVVLVPLETFAVLVAGTVAVIAVTGTPAVTPDPVFVAGVCIAGAGFLVAFPLLLVSGLDKLGLTGRHQDWDTRSWWTSGLPIYALVLLALIPVGGAVIAGHASSPVPGNAADTLPGCRWPVENHGTTRCVAEATYRAVQTDGEEDASGVLLVFLGVDLLLGAQGLAISRRHRSTN
jgi:hypothetical protein